VNSLNVFIDISGNYDFSSSGTKYLVLTSLLCTDICPGVIELYICKHRLIDQGIDVAYFHAAEDKQIVRNEVFDIICGLSHLRVDSVIVEKKKTHPNLWPLKSFYPKMIKQLLKYPFDSRGIDVSQYDKVLIFMDRESTHQREREALIKAVKVSLARHLRSVPYTICMHPSMTHLYLQMVDYCSWAIYRKWENSDFRSYNKIQSLIESEFPIFELGETVWY